MRHNKKFNHLGRTASHRSAMLSNMACSLIKHKRITTTVAKAKALKKFVEPLITKSKEDTTNSRRVVFSNLQDKIAVTELFKEISVKIADRPGGYTRIIKTGNRLDDKRVTFFLLGLLIAFTLLFVGLQHIELDAGWYGPEWKMSSSALKVLETRDIDMPW